MQLGQAWGRFRDRTWRQNLRALLRPAHMRWTVVLLLLAVVTRWPWFLLPSLVYYTSRAVSWLIARLLWSVRAKLAAFYLNTALVPLALFAAILCLLGYLVLWNISARVIEGRLADLAVACEERARMAEHEWWRARSQGADPVQAARRAIDTGWGDWHDDALVVWVRDTTNNRLLAARGTGDATPPPRPAWLRDRRFAGLATNAAQHDLELRSSVLLQQQDGAIEIGSVWPLDADIINTGLAPPAASGAIHGGVGSPERSLQWSSSRADSVAVASGILAIYRPSFRDTLAASGRGDTLVTTAATESLVDRQRARIRSRFPVLLGHYLGHPVEWINGRTRDGGPPILIAFGIEAGIQAVLSTSYEAETVVLWGALTVIATLLFVLLFATVRGLLYARSIAASVGKLDRGVHAIQSGDFSFRIEPRERDQLGALASGFNGMAEQLETLLEEQAEHRVVERELEIAREVQSRLFPQHDPDSDDIEITGVCVPAQSVSGDSYDFIPAAGGWDLVVADVSGKGMSAALLMANLQASLRGQYGSPQEPPPDPAAVLNHVNRHLGRTAEPTRFVTLFLARFEQEGVLAYCNAGHNPAALVHAGEVRWLKEGGLMLGPFPERAYDSYRVPVRPGDVLCLYTDGVTEAMDPDGHLYGEDRLGRLLLEHAARPLQQIRDQILEAVRQWRRGGAATDDVTFVLARLRRPRGDAPTVV